MRLQFVLNGKMVSVETNPTKRLSHLLRDDFHLVGLKTGCLQGKCGSCSIILNGNIVPSCIVPSFSIYNSTITTIEGMLNTQDYEDIINGFSKANFYPCTICASSKVLTTEVLLSSNVNPTEKEIFQSISGLFCRCTTPHAYAQAIKETAKIRRKRYG